MADQRSGHDQAHGACGRRQTGRRPYPVAQQSGAGEQQDPARQQEEPLGGLLVGLQRRVGDHPLDEVLLALSGLDRQPRTGGQGAGERGGEHPAGAHPGVPTPVPQGAEGREGQQEGQDDGEVNHGGVQRVGQHRTAPVRVAHKV